MNSEFQEHSQKSRPCPDRRETGEVTPARKHMTSMFQESTRESREHFQIRGGKVPQKGRMVDIVPIMTPKTAKLKNILKTR